MYNLHTMLSNLNTMNNYTSNKIKAPRLSRCQRGSVLVESVFAIIFLLVMLFGIIQYSVILSTLNTLQQISREGARFYCVHFGDNTTNNNSLADQDETITYMQQVAKGSFLTNNDISASTVTIAPVTYNNNTTLAVDSPMSVSITYDMSKRTFFGTFVPGIKKGTNDVTRTTVTLIEH